MSNRIEIKAQLGNIEVVWEWSSPTFLENSAHYDKLLENLEKGYKAVVDALESQKPKTVHSGPVSLRPVNNDSN